MTDNNPDQPTAEDGSGQEWAPVEAVRRSGYALIGFGAVVGDRLKTSREPREANQSVREWTTAEARRLVDATRQQFARLDRRGQQAWPTIRKVPGQAGRATTRAAREAARTVRWRTRVTRQAEAPADPTAAELGEIARRVGISDRSHMSRDELVAALRDRVPSDYTHMTVDELRDWARTLDVKRRSQMSKDQLTTALRSRQEWLVGSSAVDNTDEQ